MNDEIELLVRREISKEIKDYRIHLTNLLNRTTWAIGIISAIFIGGIIFFTGRYYDQSINSLDSLLEGRINEVFVKNSIDENIFDQVSESTKLSLTSYLESEEFIGSVQREVDVVLDRAVASNAMIDLENAIEKKVSQINKLNVSGRIETIPVGTVLSSIIRPELFYSLNNKKSQWVLADGRNVEGSRYHVSTSQNVVPDMRGLFLRGVNENRSDSFSDRDLNRKVGSVQQEQIKYHIHALEGVWKEDLISEETVSSSNGFGFNDIFYRGIKGLNPNKALNESSKSSLDQKVRESSMGYTLPTGDIETVPNNVAVYYYVKIN